MKSISPNLNIMIKACEKASKVLIRDFGEIEKLQVSKKGPSDFVTNSDLKTEKILIQELKKAKPNYSILSEENGIEINKDKNNTWIIDPIDGTINFLHGVPHFAISIALKTNNEIVAGLILDPIKNEMFYAEKDNGAFFNNQRIRVSKKNISSRLQNLGLNKAGFYYDASVVDTMSAFVYKQRPVEGTENVDLGVFVNLWFTEDRSKLLKDRSALIRHDSLKARLDSILNE